MDQRISIEPAERKGTFIVIVNMTFDEKIKSLSKGTWSKTRFAILWILGLLICGFFIWWVEHAFGWRHILSAWQALSPLQMGTAVLLFVFSYIFRTVRTTDYFRLNGARSFITATRLVLIHNFFNNFLPMRTGELSFPLFMQRYFSIPVTRSVPGLIWFRFLDTHLLCVIAAFLLASQRIYPVFSLSAAVLLIPLPVFIQVLSRRMIPWLGKHESTRIVKTLKHCIAGIPAEKTVSIRVWWWTFCNWIMKLCIFGWLVKSFAGIPFLKGILGSITGECSSVFLVHGFAGTGTYEGGVLAGLVSVGVRLESAVKAATNLHLFILGTSVLGMAVAYLLLPAHKPTETYGNR